MRDVRHPNPDPGGGAAPVDEREPYAGRSEDAGAAGWWCAACTFINPIAITTCSVCGTTREDARAPGGDDGDNWSPRSDDEEGEGDESSSDEVALCALLTTEEEERGRNDTPRAHASPPRPQPKLSPSTGTHDTVTITLRLKKQSNERRFLNRLTGAVAGSDALCADKSNTAFASACNGCTPAALSRAMSTWTPDMDGILLTHVNNLTGSDPNKKLFSDPKFLHELQLPRKTLNYGAGSRLLGHVNMLEIHCRLLLLCAFNKALEELLPIVNLRSKDKESIGSLLSEAAAMSSYRSSSQFCSEKLTLQWSPVALICLHLSYSTTMWPC